MILIIEGCRGTGKTTVCADLAVVFGAPIIRPFRPTIWDHHTGSTDVEKKLKAMGVPVNTFVDDLYVADVLSAISQLHPAVNYVLDRSMGSAIAHQSCPSDDTSVLDLWQQLLSRAPAVRYVWLRAPYDVAAKRVAGRPMPTRIEAESLESGFQRVYDAFQRPKLALDTSGMGRDEVVWTITHWAINVLEADTDGNPG